MQPRSIAKTHILSAKPIFCLKKPNPHKQTDPRHPADEDHRRQGDGHGVDRRGLDLGHAALFHDAVGRPLPQHARHGQYGPRLHLAAPRALLDQARGRDGIVGVLDEPVDGFAGLHPGGDPLAGFSKQSEIAHLRQDTARTGAGIERVDELVQANPVLS